MNISVRTGPRRLVFLALFALAGLLALQVSRASAAEPEFAGVSPQNQVGITFTATSSSWETAGEIGSCKTLSGSGRLTSSRGGVATLHFAQCGNLPHLCHSKESAERLNTVELALTPVYVDRANDEVGIYLKPLSGSQFSPLTCNGGLFAGELVGGLVSRALSGPRGGRSFSFAFQGSRGKQTPGQFENEHGEVTRSALELGVGNPLKFSPISLNLGLTMTAEREIRIVG
jgi:hypothetical protein